MKHRRSLATLSLFAALIALAGVALGPGAAEARDEPQQSAPDGSPSAFPQRG